VHTNKVGEAKIQKKMQNLAYYSEQLWGQWEWLHQTCPRDVLRSTDENLGTNIWGPAPSKFAGAL